MPNRKSKAHERAAAKRIQMSSLGSLTTALANLTHFSIAERLIAASIRRIGSRNLSSILPNEANNSHEISYMSFWNPASMRRRRKLIDVSGYLWDKVSAVIAGVRFLALYQ